MENKTKSKVISPKDFFLYITATLFLFLSAISFLQFIFAVIDISFPDQTAYYDGSVDMLRFALSLLIVVYPVFIFTTRKVNKYLHNTKEQRENIVRKWLIYFTLFITTIASVVTAIVLINVFLNGEITTRFGLKIISVLIVTASVFWFYKKDLQGVWYTNPNSSKKIGNVVSIILLLAVIGGFTVVGSPVEQRRINNDFDTINDLQNIQYDILNYWQKTDRLPKSLEDLDDPLTPKYSFRNRVDNNGNEEQEYTYNKLSDLKFELCANFETSSEENDSKSIQGYRKELLLDEDWEHTEGENCFERYINPEIHKINNNIDII